MPASRTILRDNAQCANGARGWRERLWDDQGRLAPTSRASSVSDLEKQFVLRRAGEEALAVVERLGVIADSDTELQNRKMAA